MNKGMLVILSAPSGTGKDTVFQELSKVRNDIVESISATTRNPRKGEAHGVNYYFKTQDEFQKMIDNNEFLEYACYNDCYYGTPAGPALDAIDHGKICFLIIERKGAQKVMKNYPDAVSIFLMPPSIEILELRLKKRNTDTDDQIKNRLEIAKEEMADTSNFDYVVFNNELEKAVDDINTILEAELQKRNEN